VKIRDAEEAEERGEGRHLVVDVLNAASYGIE